LHDRGEGGLKTLPLLAQHHVNARGMDLINVHNTSPRENKMLKRGSIVLSIWCGINIFLASIILTIVVFLNGNSPILQVASFSEAEIASLSARVIASLNALTILYNSCSVVVSVLVTIAFVVGGLGLLLRYRWWRPVTLGAAVF
jgi:hypothetical protein